MRKKIKIMVKTTPIITLKMITTATTRKTMTIIITITTTIKTMMIMMATAMII